VRISNFETWGRGETWHNGAGSRGRRSRGAEELAGNRRTGETVNRRIGDKETRGRGTQVEGAALSLDLHSYTDRCNIQT
jgi:hypothetical protein